ncbi:MAG TPA: DPP IV N-terminal domain-containing protein [Haliangiales bacterium]|nr:DPP IV N-terminal domain-containing protein [Haliangiales bacterium]
MQNLMVPALLVCEILAARAPAVAQTLGDKASLSNLKFLRDHAETRGFSLGRPTKTLPTPDGKAVLFLRAKARTPKLELYEFDVASGNTRLLLTPEDILKGAEEKLSAEEKALRERMRVSLGGFTDFQLSRDGTRILLSLSGKLYVVDRASRAVQELQTGPGTLVDPKFSPDGKRVSYVLDHDVYAFDLAAAKENPITAAGTEPVSHGLAEFVAREEMNRFSGYWWSPDSHFIAYQETDHTDVEVWYVSDPAKPGDPPYPSRYPRPGKANAKVRLGVVPVTGGDTVWMQWDRKRYPYLTSVQWEENGPLTFAVQTRDQKELVLLEADPATGRTTPLLTERDPAWLSVRQDVPRWLAGDQGFLWASERGGDWRLEWRDRHGNLKQVLVPPEFGFGELVDVNPDSGEIAFIGRPDPTQRKLFRTSLKGGSPVEMTPDPGWHSASFNPNHSMYVDISSSLGSMRRATVHRADGTRVGDLPPVAEEPPFVPNVALVRIGQGAGFYAALVRPRAFNPRKRYPVIVHVYGGPLPPDSSGVVIASMGSWLLPQWIADQGFVVVSLDGRGTPGRGHDWERAIYKHLGSVPLADQVTGLRALGRKYRELDLDRVGIFGWSFGGYLSALAVMKQPDVFKAAVAGAPPTDWLDYDTHYTERYLGMPDTDAAAYRDGSLLARAADLKRPLLLIHGTGDDNVYFRHSLKLVDALFRAGKQIELLPLSGLTHMVPDPVVNEQLYSRIVFHFEKCLGKPSG